MKRLLLKRRSSPRALYVREMRRRRSRTRDNDRLRLVTVCQQKINRGQRHAPLAPHQCGLGLIPTHTDSVHSYDAQCARFRDWGKGVLEFLKYQTHAVFRYKQTIMLFIPYYFRIVSDKKTLKLEHTGSSAPNMQASNATRQRCCQHCERFRHVDEGCKDWMV